jgi:hypothetical protein
VPFFFFFFFSFFLPDRGQGFQHAILDVEKYVQAHVALQAAIDALDADVLARGIENVESTLADSRKAFIPEGRTNMGMATRGVER